MTTIISNRFYEPKLYLTGITQCKSYVFSWQKRRLPLIAILQYSSQIVETGAICLEFFLNFLHSLLTPLFSLKCAPLLSQYWATHILEHWDYCNTQISIGEEGESHKCFKICDEYCSSLTNWLDWLANVLIFMLRKGINFNAFMMWIKITAIADENDWFFISDQICPDVSRLQQPGFWTYLQCCKCCIDCFVIQLLSEPDKLKSCSLLKARLTLLQYHQLLVAIPGLI